MSSSRPEAQQPDPDLFRAVWHVDLKSIHPHILDRFGSPKAVPKIVSVYYPQRGWNNSMKRAVLTVGLVQDLRADGATLATVKWRRREYQFTLSALGL